MNLAILRSLFANIITSIQQSSIAIVRSLKKHTFTTKVSNFPHTQKVSGEVEVDQKETHRQLQKIHAQIEATLKMLQSISIPDSIAVSNFPRQEFPKSIQVENLSEIKEVKIQNFPSTRTIEKSLENLQKSIEKIDVRPTVHVDAPKVTVPAPLVTVQERDIQFPKFPKFPEGEKLLGVSPGKYVPVRLTNGKKFYDAIGSLVSAVARSPFVTSTNKEATARVSDGGILQVDVLSNPTPIQDFNPSTEINYNQSGEVINIKKRVDGTTYVQTYSTTSGDTTVVTTQTISDWSVE